jgi:hemerythrin superfamily protein
MDATRTLVAQHRVIEALFVEVASEGRRRARSSLVSRLAEEIIAHLAAEEAVFYPAVRRAFKDLPGAGGLGGDEHRFLRIELRTVLKTSVGHPSFGERITALQTLFAEHVRGQEAEVFPRVVRLVSEAKRVALGAEILASRPHVWMVTTEGKTPIHAVGDWPLRSRVSVLLGAG